MWYVSPIRCWIISTYQMCAWFPNRGVLRYSSSPLLSSQSKKTLLGVKFTSNSFLEYDDLCMRYNDGNFCSAGADHVICEMLQNRNRNRVWWYTQLDTLTIITMLRVEHDQLVNSIKILRIYKLFLLSSAEYSYAIVVYNDSQSVIRFVYIMWLRTWSNETWQLHETACSIVCLH